MLRKPLHRKEIVTSGIREMPGIMLWSIQTQVTTKGQTSQQNQRRLRLRVLQSNINPPPHVSNTKASATALQASPATVGSSMQQPEATDHLPINTQERRLPKWIVVRRFH